MTQVWSPGSSVPAAQPVPPSSTGRGRQFLGNFTGRDSFLAKVLIDNFEFQTVDELVASLESAVGHHMPTKGAVAAYPVRNVADFEGHRVTGLLQFLRGENAALRRARAAFTDYDPAEPLPLNAGSELVLAHTLLRLSRRYGKQFSVAPDPLQLARKRIEHVLFLDDFSGSGQQAQDYVLSWRKNAHIAAMLQRGGVTTTLIIGSASASALERLRAANIVDHVDVRRFVNRNLTVMWDSAMRRRVLNFCERHGNLSKEALGFGNSMGFFIPATGVPNNVPWVFRRPPSASWNPLFVGKKGREIAPDFKRQVWGYRPPERPPAYLIRSRKFLGVQDHARWQLLYTLLDAANQSTSIDALERRLGIPARELQVVVGKLVHTGLILASPDSLLITAQGVEELAALRLRGGSQRVTGRAVPYYPLRLRGVGSS